MTYAARLGLLDAEVLSARSGQPTLALGEKKILSPYDPVKEAIRRAAALHVDRVRLVGLGLGYLAEALGGRLERQLVFEGEAERFRRARGRDVTTILAPERIVPARDADEVRAFLDDALRDECPILLDPSLDAAPRFRARILDYRASFDVESGASDAALLEAPTGELPSGPMLEALLDHQSRHGFTEYPPFEFELIEAPRVARRILVIQPSSIGDVLYFTPALTALRTLHPAARIVYLVEQEAAAVVRGAVDRALIARRTDWIEGDEGSRESLARRLRAIEDERFDLVINPHATARCAWYATWAARHGAVVLGAHFRDGCPVVAGNLHHLRWIHVFRDRLTPHPAPGDFAPPVGFTPRLTVAADLARRAGVGRCAPHIAFAPGARSRARVAVFLREAAAGTPIVAVHTGSNAAVRRYRRDRWPLVCDGLARDLGARVVLIGGPADRERHAWIRARCAAPPLDASGLGGLGFTAALLERCALLVGPETSTVHLAAARGIPTLTITGRVETGWTGAYATRSLVLHGPADPPWCGLLAPALVVRAAAFVLGRGDIGVLPEGFDVSWTGDSPPNEFFREAHPRRVFSPVAYHDHLMALAWENLLAAVNGTLGYPPAAVTAREARAWLGAPSADAAALIRASIERLAEPASFGGAFHRPLAHCRSAAVANGILGAIAGFLNDVISRAA